MEEILGALPWLPSPHKNRCDCADIFSTSGFALTPSVIAALPDLCRNSTIAMSRTTIQSISKSH